LLPGVKNFKLLNRDEGRFSKVLIVMGNWQCNQLASAAVGAAIGPLSRTEKPGGVEKQAQFAADSPF